MLCRGAGMTRTLIVGLGSIGRRHLRNLATLGESDIVLLRTHRATLADDELQGYKVESDLGTALKQHRPDAVIVANPTALHLGAALPAARQGCRILLEKPISDSMRGVDELQTASSHNGAQVLVGFQFRFHPLLQQARQIVLDEGIGKLMSARVHYGEYLPAWHPWEDYRQGYAARADLGGGVLLTQCHALDYLPWLIGQPEAVSGFLGKLGDLEVDVEDTAEIVLRLAGGRLGSIHLNYTQRPARHHIDIAGTRGSIHCDMLAGTMRLYRAVEGEWEDYSVPEGWERNTMFLEEMRHFLKVARGEMRPLCPLEDGIRVQELIEAVRRSDASGQVISLSG